MKEPRDMTRAELERAQALASRKASEVCDAMIAAGRGYERPSETRTKTDPLALAYIATADRQAVLQAEHDRRMTYHGKLTPIKAAK